MDAGERYAAIPLDHIPESFKVTGTLGLQRGIWGCFLIAALFLMLAGSQGPATVFDVKIYLALFIAGMGLIAWEIIRRRNPTVLVEQDGMIVVYRKGSRDIVVSRDEIRREKIDLMVVVKIGVPLLLCTVLFMAVAVAIMGDEKRITADTLIILSFGLALGASLACAAFTTFCRMRLLVPIRNSRWLAEETVLVTRKQCRQFFPGLT